MLRKIARFLDSLFWETRIITVRKTKPVVQPDEPDSPRETSTYVASTKGFKIMTNTSEDSKYGETGVTLINLKTIIFPGRTPVDIPDSVLSRPALIKDGVLNRTFLSAYAHAPITTCINIGLLKKGFIDNVPLTSSNNVNGVTKKKIYTSAAGCMETIERNQIVPVTIDYLTMKISFYQVKDCILLKIVGYENAYIRLKMDIVKQFTEVSSCTKMAYVFARSIMLDLDASNVDIKPIDEDDFARHILLLILHSFDL